MKTIKPNGKRILVKINEVEEQQMGGIILPSQNDQTLPREGVVLAIGQVNDINVGDKVIISKTGGVEVENDQGKCHIVDIDDVVAKVK